MGLEFKILKTIWSLHTSGSSDRFHLKEIELENPTVQIPKTSTNLEELSIRLTNIPMLCRCLLINRNRPNLIAQYHYGSILAQEMNHSVPFYDVMWYSYQIIMNHNEKLRFTRADDLQWSQRFVV